MALAVAATVATQDGASQASLLQPNRAAVTAAAVTEVPQDSDLFGPKTQSDIMVKGNNEAEHSDPDSRWRRRAEAAAAAAAGALSLRVPANTLVPFSVAPQPVQDTPEVALAKRHFMTVFNRIKAAVTAVAAGDNLHHHHMEPLLLSSGDDHGMPHSHHHHDNSHHLHDLSEKNAHQLHDPQHIKNLLLHGHSHNHVHDHHEHSKHTDDGSHLSPDDDPLFSVIPDIDTEPEYFMPSVKVDPLLLSRLDPPLPPNSLIQEFRPLDSGGFRGRSSDGGVCYDIVLLVPEEDEEEELQAIASGRTRLDDRPRSDVLALKPVDLSSKGANFSFHSPTAFLDSLPHSGNRLKSQAVPKPPWQNIPAIGAPAFLAQNGTSRQQTGKPGRVEQHFFLHHSDLKVTRKLPDSLAKSKGIRRTLPQHFKTPQLSFVSQLHKDTPTTRG